MESTARTGSWCHTARLIGPVTLASRTIGILGLASGWEVIESQVSARRIGLCWEATRAPWWTRIPQAWAVSAAQAGLLRDRPESDKSQGVRGAGAGAVGRAGARGPGGGGGEGGRGGGGGGGRPPRPRGRGPHPAARH